MNEEKLQKYWYITRHKKMCGTCKHYEPLNEVTGYDAWYDKDIISDWASGYCTLLHHNRHEAWRQTCGKHEEKTEEEYIKSYD